MTWSFANGAFKIAKDLNYNLFISSFEGTPFPSFKYARTDQVNDPSRRINAHSFFQKLRTGIENNAKSGDL